ncbi:Exodeoxyribonuclease 7 small subunit [Arsenophonus endosymbiont of Aleurodicus dispersus]|uniref:exodeoxyribonuclease VII small subunit n=1 Tax=Arsenophonus endosymbiont of Aleurodicus dispersus TaxID=235559 RepID=UPI000EAC4DE5|nr:exodeoxyribonuclease VII small subunit [Arsenophonus endosymbiont of Aleurodicus dispersus]VAY02148.1 Exodeoxyribonuclease 7 small subunit [Arsenophonus endosymbiont of Aleurodicus dispersus]
MAKKKISDKQNTLSFETYLTELEQIVTRLESGELSLEKALSEFEHGIKLARQGQKTLQQAEQRVKILLQADDNAPLDNFTSEDK